MSDFRAMFAGFTDFNVSEGFFPNINLQEKLNWAEEFIQNVLIPRLPEAVAAHFPVELGTVLVMFAFAGIFVAVVPLLPLVLVLCRTKSRRPVSEQDRSHAGRTLGNTSNVSRRYKTHLQRGLHPTTR